MAEPYDPNNPLKGATTCRHCGGVAAIVKHAHNPEPVMGPRLKSESDGYGKWRCPVKGCGLKGAVCWEDELTKAGNAKTNYWKPIKEHLERHRR